MIPVSCSSNHPDLDGHGWPDQFLVKPDKGDLVQSESGKIARIASVIHYQSRPRMGECGADRPGIRVELVPL